MQRVLINVNEDKVLKAVWDLNEYETNELVTRMMFVSRQQQAIIDRKSAMHQEVWSKTKERLRALGIDYPYDDININMNKTDDGYIILTACEEKLKAIMNGKTDGTSNGDGPEAG